MQTKTLTVGGTCLVPIAPLLLEQCPLGDVVEVSAGSGALIIRPLRRRPREGWAGALSTVPASTLASDADDLAAFRDAPNTGDNHEWPW